MSIQNVPQGIARVVEFYAPGVFNAWWDALIAAHQGVPVWVTDYWRSPADNVARGGAPDSQHLVGLGLDVVYPGDPSPAIAAMRARGLVVVPESDHVHVQAFSAGVLRRVGLFDSLGL